MTVIVSVELIENAHHNCICISLLKLWRLLKEFQARVLLKKVFEHRLEVICDDGLRSILRNQFEQPSLVSLPVIVSSLPEPNQLLLVDLRFSTKLRKRSHLQL